MRQIWLIVFLGMVFVVSAQEANLQRDAALQKRITVWMSLASLAEVLESVSKQTGVPLRCQDVLRDVKLSVFVQEGVAATLLENLAQLLKYRWRKREEGGYMLYMPDETRQALEDALKQDRQATEQALRDMLAATREWLSLPRDKRKERPAREYAGVVGSVPLEEILLESELTEPNRSPQEAVRESMAFYLSNYALQGEEEGMSLMLLMDLGAGGSLLHCLAEADESVLRQLLEGRTIGFSTRPAPRVFPLPSQALLPYSLRSQATRRPDETLEERYEPGSDTYTYTVKVELQNPEFGGMWVRLSPWGDQLEYQVVGLVPAREEAGAKIELFKEETFLALPVDAYWRQTPFWRAWEAWATPAREFSAKLKNRRPLERPKPELDIEMPLLAAHALEWIAWHTGYPIISDASRFALAPYHNSLDNPHTLLGLLQRDLWLRFDESGYLLARHKRYWMLNQFEIPERLVRPAEAKWLRGEWLTLDDLAPIAGYLNDAQARGFYSDRQRSLHQFWTAFDNSYLYRGLPALRFWASLGDAQRRQAQRGEWIPEAALTLPQKERFRAALNAGFPPPERLFLNPPTDYNRYFAGIAIYNTAPSSDEQTRLLRFDDLQTVLQHTPSQPAFRLFTTPLTRELEVKWRPADKEYATFTQYTLRATEQEADFTPDAIRRRFVEDGVLEGAKLTSRLDFYLEFFAPPCQFERYMIMQSREKQLPSK